MLKSLTFQKLTELQQIRRLKGVVFPLHCKRLRQGGSEVWFPDQLFPNKDLNVLFEQTLQGF